MSVCGDFRISSYRNKTEKYFKKKLKNQTVSCQDGAKERGFAANRSPGLTVGMIIYAMPSTLVYEETPKRRALEGLHNLCREN